MTTFEQFAFQTPLYSKLNLPKNLKLKGVLCDVSSVKVDGHCPFRSKNSTFSRSSNANWNITHAGGQHLFNKLQEAEGFYSLKIVCARDAAHEVHFWCLVSQDTVEKVGQYPSLADIANDEAATYRSVLEKVDASELHKAIGLGHVDELTQVTF